jgi:hypothetical protein
MPTGNRGVSFSWHGFQDSNAGMTGVVVLKKIVSRFACPKANGLNPCHQRIVDFQCFFSDPTVWQASDSGHGELAASISLRQLSW